MPARRLASRSSSGAVPDAGPHPGCPLLQRPSPRLNVRRYLTGRIRRSPAAGDAPAKEAGSPPPPTHRRGSNSRTPASATSRSTTVTRPKSRSTGATEIRPMSSSSGRPAIASTAKPAIAVTPEASTADAGARVGPAQRLADQSPAPPRSRVVARGKDDAELGGDRDHERTQRGRHRIERDAQRGDDQGRPTCRDQQGIRGTIARRPSDRSPPGRHHGDQARQRQPPAAVRKIYWPRPQAREARPAPRSYPGAVPGLRGDRSGSGCR